ncbi:iron complex transport system substrate-binding protein [Lentzea fradiae]|uniref:Iron complex transport system substrate-binding protein n=1 Tax=Lentzea fradiae TaxID=200378 RepID=A0A1G7L0K3_9PSEU|nr:ABC transporter substrate-binding protein [Lentzea fradiae]SDF43018.1 iron complex transport system substrate-binding protein [Lentzea fradiae]
MKRTVLVLAVVLPLTACGTANPSPTSVASGQITVKDCAGKDVTFDKVPERVVTLDGYAAQTLVRLGVADRVVGTGFPAPFGADSAPHAERLARIPVLAERVPVNEVVAAQQPDLVLTSFESFGGPPGSPKEADLVTMGAKGLTSCLKGSSEGPLTDLSPTYEYVRKLGAVFGVRDRAEQLVAELEGRAQAVAAKVTGDRPKVLVLQDNPVAGQPLRTSGAGTIAHALISMAGGQSVFSDVSSMHAEISPEEVVRRDPEVVWVITDYTFAKLKGQELVAAVRTNPLLAGTTAGRQSKVVSTSQYLVSFPSPLNLDGLEQLANALHAG